MIRLVGPGGAGKSRTGSLLAERLGVPFIDLDERFGATVGDISKYIESQGYDAYAGRNVRVYADLLADAEGQASVLALSSGFMTYQKDVHPQYEAYRRDIATSPSTFVLLPSLDFETCVAETVRRQLRRPFSRSAEREEQVVRARFAVYRELPAAKVTTMRPVIDVVEDLALKLAAHRALDPAPPASLAARVSAGRKADSEPTLAHDQTILERVGGAGSERHVR